MRPLVILFFALALLVPTWNVLAAAPTPATFTNYSPTSGGTGAGEPSIGVNWLTGAVMSQAGATTFTTIFNDAVSPATATWTARFPIGGVVGTGGLDPILFTDSAVGKTFAGGDFGACGVLGVSTNDGAAWTPSANPCAAPSADHETIGGGAWHAGAIGANAASDRVYYYCADTQVIQCAESWDGGVTFNAPLVISTSCLGTVGKVKVGPDGTVYIPKQNCGAGPTAFVSTNSGLSWTHHDVGASSGTEVFDPGLGVSQQHSYPYLAWEGANHHAFVSRSTDQGAHWSAPVDLSVVGGIGAISFPSVTVGDDDRAAVAFLGSTTGGNGHASGFTGTWDLYVATTYDGGATWNVVKATSNPVQRGYICDSGTTCGSGRNLLDFNDATMDAKGRVLAVYSDGCIGACAAPGGTASQSTSSLLTIARQSGGTCLLAAVCG